MIGAQPSEIYFTASGTESDHWAIWGARAAKRRAMDPSHMPQVVTSSIEHPAVLQYLESLHSEVCHKNTHSDDACTAWAVRHLHSLCTLCMVNFIHSAYHAW